MKNIQSSIKIYTKFSLSIAALLCAFCLAKQNLVHADELDTSAALAVPSHSDNEASDSDNQPANETSVSLVETNNPNALVAEANHTDAPSALAEAAPDAEGEATSEEVDTEETQSVKVSVTVPHEAYQLFATQITLKSGEKIADQYNADYKKINLSYQQNAKGVYELSPSLFEDSKGKTYRLEEFLALTPQKDETFSIKQFSRKIPISFYIVDGTPEGEKSNIQLGVLNIRKDNDKTFVVQTVDFSDVKYFDVQPEKGGAPVHQGFVSKTIYLDHLADTTSNKIQNYWWNENDVLLPKGLEGIKYSLGGRANYVTGGYYVVRTTFPDFAWISVSDASPDHPVDVSFDLIAHSLQDHNRFPEKGQKLTLTGQVSGTITQGNKPTLILLKGLVTRTYENGHPLGPVNFSSYNHQVITEREPEGDRFPVIGRATIEYKFPDIEGYTKRVVGDGFSPKSLFSVYYYKNVPLIFDAGEGTLKDPNLASVNGLHTRAIKEVLSQAPDVNAPEGYRFAGWKVNDQELSLDTVLNETSPLTFHAKYEKIEKLADHVSVSGKVELDNGVTLTDEMITSKVTAPEGAKLTVTDKPETSNAGEYSAKVQVEKDGESITVNVPVTVKDTHRLTPEDIKPIEVVQGASEIPYASALPERDDIQSLTPTEPLADTSTPGDKNATVTVTFTDGHSEEVTIPIKIVEPTPSLEDLVEVTGSIELFEGEALTDAMIEEKISRPKEASLAIDSKPDTTQAGNYNVSVTVKKGDETLTVLVPVIVKEKRDDTLIPGENTPADPKPGNNQPIETSPSDNHLTENDNSAGKSETDLSTSLEASDVPSQEDAQDNLADVNSEADQADSTSNEKNPQNQSMTSSAQKLPQTGVVSTLGLGLILTLTGSVFSWRKRD